jgi:NADH-quinone oxidoreductase subunit H
MELNSILLTGLYGVVAVVVILTICAYAVLAERKVSAWIQGRLGPNRTRLPLLGNIPVLGTILTRLGMFQPIADGLKMLLKEDIIPAHVNKPYYLLAPAVVLIPAVVTIAFLPFGQYVDAEGVLRPLVLANLDVGLLFLLAVSSLGVYGIILAGWAANSKYPFLGAIRASAQLISYELAMAFSILPVIMWANVPGLDTGLNLFGVVQQQQGAWYILITPISALIFMVSLFAETNRLPFDMAECETELVSGHHTEYGSMKFGLFPVAEYAHMLIGSGVFTVLFLGGWNILPWIPFPQELFGSAIAASALSVVWFIVKLLVLMFFFIWVRWTLPRFRYDQVMSLGWKMLLPLAIANLVFNAILIAVCDYSAR